MNTPNSTKLPRVRSYWEGVRGLAAIGSLAVLVYLVHLYYVGTPDLGFQFHPRTGVVTAVSPACPEVDCIRPGDRLLQLGPVLFDEFSSNPQQRLPDPADNPSGLEILVSRDGEALAVQPPPFQRSAMEETARIVGPVLPSLFFWIAGTFALLFLRPISRRGILLVGLFYSFAVLLAAGLSSWAHAGYSWYLVDLSTFCVAGFAVHFHFLCPAPIVREAGRFGMILWSLLLVALFFGMVDPRSSITAVVLVLSILFCLASLLARLVSSRGAQVRQSSRVMAGGLFVGLFPIFLLAVVPSIHPQTSAGSSGVLQAALGVVSLAILPIWPLSYLYVVHRNQISRMSFRANRLLGSYAFYSLLTLVFLVLQIVLVHVWTGTSVDSSSGRLVPSLVLISVLLGLVIATPLLRERSQRWVDRSIFGLLYDPKETLAHFAERIPTATTIPLLRDLIGDEILPALMIRRSALFLTEGQEAEILYRSHDEDRVPTTGQFLDLDFVESHSWTLVVLPLSVGGRRLGVWLLGDRDPDDYYSNVDRDLLERLANMIAAVVQGQRAAFAKARFLTNISHELRTPMNGVLGSVGALQRTALSGDQRSLCSMIESSGRGLLRLVDDILDLTTGDLVGKSLVREFDALVEVETVVCRFAARAATKDLDVVIRSGAEEMRWFRGDVRRISTVLRCLIENAIKFTHSGEIVVEVDSAFGVDGAELRLAVSDTGIGIEAGKIETIFEEFTQVDSSSTRAYGGAGLGLPLCRKLVQSNGGEIGAESVLGVGSTFWFRVPEEPDLRRLQPRVVETRAKRLAGSVLWHLDSCASRRSAVREQFEGLGGAVRDFDSVEDFLLALEMTKTAQQGMLILVDERVSGWRNLLQRVTAREDSITMLLSRSEGQVEDFNLDDLDLDSVFTWPLRPSQVLAFLLGVVTTDSHSEKREISLALSPSESSVGSLSVDFCEVPGDGGGRVLVVEDNPINQLVTRKMLEALKCRVQTANDGARALEKLEVGAVDLVLMDCQMPVMDGFEATREARRRGFASAGRPLPIVALTAHGLDEDIRNCLECGMDEVLVKPIELDQLSEVLKRWIPGHST